MKATSIEKLCDWLGVSELELFNVAFEDATGIVGRQEADAAQYFLRGDIPQYVVDYLTHVIFPKLIIRGGKHETIGDARPR